MYIIEALLLLFLQVLFPIDPIPAAAPLSQTEVLSASRSAHLVTRVVDGDTLKVSSGDGVLTVRVIGINTPETVDPRKAVECYGKEASEKMRSLVENQRVILTNDLSQSEQDRYGRLLRYVELTDGTDVGLTLIQEGFAHEYTYNSPYARQQFYRAAQKSAQDDSLGFWSSSACN